MRILVVHNRYREPGGEDSVVAAETRLLEDAGHTVQLYEVDNPAGALGAAAMLAQAPWNRSAANAVSEAANRFGPDVVHVHNTWFSLSLAILWALDRSPAARVMTLHNYRPLCLNSLLYRDGHRCLDCVGRLPWPGVLHRCYRSSTVASSVGATNIGAHRALGTWHRHTELLLTPSSLAREMLIRGGFPPGHVVVKPNFAPDPGPRALAPSRSSRLLYAGRFSEDKGLLRLLSAWDSAPGDLELLLVGDGELAERIRSAGPRVQALPWLDRSELNQLMLRSRAMVVPTQMFETFGLAAAEAMAAGLPVLTTEGSAVAEVVGGAGPPPLPSADLPSDWDERLRLLAADGPVDEWGAIGRRRWEDLYSPSEAAARLLEAYELALARRRRS